MYLTSACIKVAQFSFNTLAFARKSVRPNETDTFAGGFYRFNLDFHYDRPWRAHAKAKTYACPDFIRLENNWRWLPWYRHLCLAGKTLGKISARGPGSLWSAGHPKEDTLLKGLSRSWRARGGNPLGCLDQCSMCKFKRDRENFS